MVEVRVEQDGDVVVRVDVVAVRERGAHHVTVRLEGADPEVDRVGRVPHEHVGRVFGGAAVHRSVLREARQQCGATPRRLVEHAVDLHRGLDAGDADVELFGETVVGRAAVGGALKREEQREHGVKRKCGMRSAECGMNGPRWERHLRIVSRPCHSAFRIPHSAFYS